MKPWTTARWNEWVAKWNLCHDGEVWLREHLPAAPVEIIEKLIAEDHLDGANWGIVRFMDYKEYVAYAIYAAEQAIGIFEKKYPDDKRPREAIEAAKKCLENPTKKNKAAASAAVAAASAAYAASASASASAAVAASASAASASASAAAAYAAAAYAAAVAATYAATRKEMKLKILRYGLELLAERGRGR